MTATVNATPLPQPTDPRGVNGSLTCRVSRPRRPSPPADPFDAIAFRREWARVAHEIAERHAAERANGARS
jgi:hypothetical protein